MAADYQYLMWAYHSGGAFNVDCPVARASLKATGLMVPARLRQSYGGNVEVFGMALTKKGQRRAQEIVEQMAADYSAHRKNKNRRGVRGAAWPKRWKIDKRARPTTEQKD